MSQRGQVRLYKIWYLSLLAITGLIAKELWTVLERKHPFVLGPVNKNNDRILELFGDQGGH